MSQACESSDLARLPRQCGDAARPGGRIGNQGHLDRRLVVQRVGEHDRILEGEASALAEIGLHGMARVPDEHQTITRRSPYNRVRPGGRS